MEDLSKNSVWTSLPLPGFIIDAEDRIETINPAAELFTNTSLKAMRGDPIWDKLAVDAPLDDAFSRVRRNLSELYINDVDVSTGSNAPDLCNIQIAPLAGSDGKVMLLIAPRKIAGRLNRAFSPKSSAKSAIGMAEMLAHEIKNPLAGITGAAQLLSMNLSPEDRELTDLIVAESRRIVALLEQVEQFGNLRPPERKPVNLHDLLDRARKSAMVGIAANMEIVENYDPSLPATFWDGDQLLQVFLNLIKNAAEAAGKQGGKLTLRTFYDRTLRMRRADGSQSYLPLQVEVMDDGPGIPPEIVSDIFDPFVSGKENGTGLGLALVSKIITENDGMIAVDSVPGRTVFRISLPVVPKDYKEEA